MNKSSGESVNVDEFIESYIVGEMNLKDRMNQIIKAIVERKRQIADFTERLKEAKVGIQYFMSLGNRKT